MRIVHFGKYYPPEWGGIEAVTEALAEEHSALGHDLAVVCFTRKEAGIEDGAVRVVRKKVQVDLGSQPLSFGYVFSALHLGRRADVVHIHTPNALAMIAALLLPRRVKLLVHWHSDVEGGGLTGFLGKVIRPLEYLALRRADVVVATSPVYVKASRMLRLFSDKVKAIPLGIPELKEPDPKPQAEGYVLSVGRLVPYKGFNVLLDAVAQTRSHIKFLIVGTGPQEAALKAQAAENGIEARVQFLGKVGTEELQALYQNATVFCLPSITRHEAFGVVLLEAMRAGCPLLTTNIPGSGVPWVNQDGITGRVVPINDPVALASSIDTMLADPDKLKSFGSASYARFLGKFTRQSMSRHILLLYE